MDAAGSRAKALATAITYDDVSHAAQPNGTASQSATAPANAAAAWDTSTDGSAGSASIVAGTPTSGTLPK